MGGPGQGLVERWVADRSDDPVAWVLAPYLWARYRARPVGTDDKLPGPGLATRAVEQVAGEVMGHAKPSGQGTTYRLVGETLFVESSENHRRVQRPILDRLESRGDAVTEVKLRPDRSNGPTQRRGARTLFADFCSEVQEHELGPPEPSGALLRNFLSVPRHIAFAEAALDSLKPRAVVVHSNHSKPARACALAARARGIPTVYFPHAPLIADAPFQELPFDWAGLRGQAEVGAVAGGGQPERIVAVGNPSTPAELPPLCGRGGPVVFALSPWSEEVLAEIIAAVHSGTGSTPVVVAPHPAQSPAKIKSACPTEWTVSEHRTTLELLAEGAAVMIQHSSGVALEALLFGIPTVELLFGKDRPNYCFMQEPHLSIVPDAAALPAAIDSALRVPKGRSQEIRDWGLRWNGPGGEEAAAGAVELIDRAAGRSAPGPVSDFWGSSAVPQ